MLCSHVGFAHCITQLQEKSELPSPTTGTGILSVVWPLMLLSPVWGAPAFFIIALIAGSIGMCRCSGYTDLHLA